MSQNPLSADLDHILDHTRDLWEELRGERLFITGGTGFFGCWLMESFIWANDHLNLHSTLSVLTRSPDAFRAKAPHLAGHPAVTLIEGDVRNFSFHPGTFSYIIHAATESNVKLNIDNPLLMLDTIVEGTRHTLDFAMVCGTKKFLLTSSGAVYGRQPLGLISHIPENFSGAPDPLDPRSTYGEGKRMAEHLCALYARETAIEMKIARCFAFVGPYLPLDHFAMGNFIRDGLNGGPIVIQGDGTPQRSYLYAADLAIWLWTVLMRGSANQPYNIGSEYAISISDLAKVVSSAMSPQPAVLIKKNQDTNETPELYVPSTKKAREELGLQEWIELKQSIYKTIVWRENNNTIIRRSLIP